MVMTPEEELLKEYKKLCLYLGEYVLSLSFCAECVSKNTILNEVVLSEIRKLVNNNSSALIGDNVLQFKTEKAT